MSFWLLQANPQHFAADVSTWRGSDLTRWCVVRYRAELTPGDGFAFWVSGHAGGVHALGTVLTPALLVSAAELDPQADPATQHRRRHVVGLRVDTALFDRPVPRRVLATDRRFATASVLRQPFAANPFPLTPLEWQSVRDHAHGPPAAGPT